MPIKIKLINIKQSKYLIIPKTIADLINIRDDEEFDLDVYKQKLVYNRVEAQPWFPSKN